MNVTDVMMQMMMAAGQIAQNTLPQTPSSENASQPKREFKDLLEDKRTQAGNATEDGGAQKEEGPEGPEKDAAQLPAEAAAQQAVWQQPMTLPVLPLAAANVGQPAAEFQVQGLPVTAAAPETAVPQQQAAVLVQPAAEGETQAAAPAPQAQPQGEAQPAQAAQPETVPQLSQAEGQPSGQAEGQGAEALPQRQQARQELEPSQVSAAPEQPLFRTVEEMPVKVGDGEPVDTARSGFEAQLAGKITAAAEQDVQRVEIQLSPENLGSIVVEMTRSQDGALSVVLHAENDKAARLLGEHSAALSLALQNSGQGEVRVEVPQPKQQENQPWQQPEQENGQGRGGQQQQRRRQETEDFLQQLRLGLFSLDTTD